ncbi:mucin-like protein [Branchiostoma floridae x Branchiostoma japonicum]
MAAVRLCCVVLLLSLLGLTFGELRGPPGSVCSFVASRHISYQVENRRRRDSSPGVWDYLKEVFGGRAIARYPRALTIIYGIQYFTDYECCLGWNHLGETCQADCHFPCRNGLCVSVNVCECDDGWEGDHCDQDIDECWYQIDECDDVNGGCINTQGSYNCTCNAGLHLINGTFCHATPDTDECATGNGGCDQNCHNNHGSFTCSCNSGYNLAADGRTCIDINECSTDNGGCDHDCTNYGGGRACSCRLHHRLVGETTCRDDNLYPYGEEVNGQPSQWNFSKCQEEKLPIEGFRFFGRRHHNIFICDNGIVAFDKIARPTWPTLIQSVAAFSEAAVIAPFLAKSDASVLDNLPEDHRTQIFYSFHEADDGNLGTDEILNRARNDGRSTPGYFAPDYTPVWALVVTWTRVAPDCSSFANGLCPRPHDQLPVNDFQLVISTDGIQSFVNFIYPRLAQQWVSPVEAAAGGDDIYPKPNIAVGGYSAGDGTLLPFTPATNASLVDDGIEYSGQDNEHRLPGMRWSVSMRNLYLVSVKWRFPLQNQHDPSPPQRGVADCSRWIRSQVTDDPTQLFGYAALPSVGSCPCNAEQAWFDPTYMYNLPVSNFSGPTCATSRLRVHAFLGSERLIMWRTCCYGSAYWYREDEYHPNADGLRRKRERLGGGARRSGIRGGHLIINNQAEDEAAFQSCCTDAETERNGWYCDRFVMHRPLSSPPQSGCRTDNVNIPWIGYDPHLTTIDGNKYSFNGLGDFLLTDVDNGEYQVQCRLSLAPGSDHATMITAMIAYQRDKQPVQIQVVGDSSLELYVNGSLTDLSVFEEGYELEVGDNSLVTQLANNSLLVVFFSGITVKATANKAMLFVEFTSPAEFKGKIRGLLGKFDEDPSNDFESSNGTILPVDASERQLYEDFGLTWQVTSDDGPLKSLFPDHTRDSFRTRSTFYPHFTDEITFIDPDLEAQARATCRNNTDCLFDVSQTGDLDLGKDLVEDEQKIADSQTLLNTFPPTLTGPDSVYATVNETVTVVVTAADNTTRFPLFVLGPEVQATVQLNVRESEATLVWQVTSDSPLKLQLDVYNAENASAQYWPVIYMCSCHNGGNCNSSADPDPAIAGGENKFHRQTCSCAPGYTGERCEMEVDACVVNLNPCFTGSECTDLPPPAGHGADGYTCGPCPDGYTGDGFNCEDRDECAGAEGDACQHVCRNFLGGFDCVCNEGYSLADDSVSCFDIDECSTGLNNCSQLCENTDGAFNCACRDGFVLASDGQNCEPSNPCSGPDNPGCDSELGWCVLNSTGSVECVCMNGYKLDTDGVTCKDEDECLTGNHHCEQLCNNTAGGYNCYCRDGYYTVVYYVVTCLEIDECSEGYDNCTEHERCVNDPGSFHCDCREETLEVNGICYPVMATHQPTPPATASPTNRPTSSWTGAIENVIETNTIVIEIASVIDEVSDRISMFKQTLAVQVTQFCSQQVDHVPACRREDWGRNPRSYSPAVFLPEDVHVSQGYPRPASDPTRTTLAFFMSYSDTGRLSPVPLETVRTVLQQSKSQLEEALGGKTFIYIGSLQDYLDDVTPTPTDVGPDEIENSQFPVVYVTIGIVGSVAVIVIVAVIVYLLVKKRRQVPKATRTPVQVLSAVPLTHAMTEPSKQAFGIDNPVAIMDTKA